MIILILAIDEEIQLGMILDQIDEVIIYIYIAEAIIKVVGLGIEKYFEDDWNT